MSAGHRVDVVRFTPGVPSALAPIECSCGWVGQVEGFGVHSGTPQGAIAVRNDRPARPRYPSDFNEYRKANAEHRGKRELFTGCQPSGLPGDRCANCGRLLMLGGKRTRDGQRRVQHAPMRSRPA